MKFNLQLNILLAAISGIIAGLYFSDYHQVYSFLGQGFITILKYIVVPLVFTSLITGIIKLGSIKSLQQMGLKTLIYFILTTLVASIVGIILTLLIQPGKGFLYQQKSTIIIKKAISFKLMLLQLIPTNFLDFISGSNMLFVIILSVSLGLIFIFMKKHIKFPIDELFEGFSEFMTILTTWIISVLPIGIFGLVAIVIIETGLSAFIPLLFFMLTVFIGLTIHALIILPLLTKIIIKSSPIVIAKEVFSSLATGFTTASSAATLPILMEDTRQKLKVPNKVTSFVLPLGITINMDGTAIFQSVATIFIAQIYGIDLTLVSLCLIVFMTIIASIGAAAIPSAGIITLAMILTAVGIPIEGIGIIIGIDRILDMMRTTVNLWGNTIAVLIITKWLGIHAYEH